MLLLKWGRHSYIAMLTLLGCLISVFAPTGFSHFHLPKVTLSKTLLLPSPAGMNDSTQRELEGKIEVR
jgi:hypothetical protein